MTKRLQIARGHTLLELMIAMALGLIVTAGAVSLYNSQRRAFESAANALRIREAGWSALMLIGQQLQMAGFASADSTARAPTPLFGCSGGRPSGTDDALTCTKLTTGSDGVVVRYEGDGVSTWLSTNGSVTDCLGQAVTGSGAVSGGPRALVVNRYFANVSSSTGEPELYCEGNGNQGSAQPLVEGVERVVFRYWLAGASVAVEASAVPIGRWTDVVAVDLCVLVRGAAQAGRSRYIDCNGASVMSTDSKVRQTFSRQVRLRNVLGAGDV